MGKINQPNNNIEQTNSGGTNQDQSVSGETLHEGGELSLPSVDEYSLTNEAVRLIQLKTELGLDAGDKDHDHEIKGILELSKASGIKNKNQLSAKLREIKYRLGVQESKDAVKSIYQYLKIDSQIKSLVNQQEILHAKGK